MAGAHRIHDPEKTFRWIKPCLSKTGITRLADITGLDRIGVPVVLGIRPNARSVSVSQGKGETTILAKVSAAMESIEAYHAEHISLPTKLCSYNNFKNQSEIINPKKLAVFLDTKNLGHRVIPWVKGFDLISQNQTWVPLDAVCLDFTTTPNKDVRKNSNGLASGNHLLEAVSHAILELVEKDARFLFNNQLNPNIKQVDLNSIDSTSCAKIIQAIVKADLDILILDISQEIGIPVFTCFIIEPNLQNQFAPLRYSLGHGAHLSKEVALMRALTEAAQTRLTMIAGCRDDIAPNDYYLEAHKNFETEKDELYKIYRHVSEQQFQQIPSLESDRIDTDVRLELEMLMGSGFDQAVLIDLTKEAIGIPVVRLIIPGLQFGFWGLIDATADSRILDKKISQLIDQNMR